MSDHPGFYLDQDDPRLFQEHALQLTVLQHIDHICRSHSLRYYLVFGTLLGAVRHQGFIPWDDDLDIAMPRTDFERFCEIAGDHLDASKYFLQTETTDPMYPNTFAKIRCERTLVQEKASIKGVHHEGVYVDIFPLDHAPDRLPAKKLRQWRYLFYHLSIRRKIQGYQPERWQSRISTYFGHRMSLEWLRTKRNKVIYGDAERLKHTRTYAAYPASASEVPSSFIAREPFERTAELSFCGHPVLVPEGYDAHLREYFGDYMRLPDEDKRKGHLVKEVEIDTLFWRDEILAAWPKVAPGRPLPKELRDAIQHEASDSEYQVTQPLPDRKVSAT